MKKTLVGLWLFLSLASGQVSNIVVTVGNLVVNFNKQPPTLVTVGISPATANGAGVAVVPVSFSTSRMPVSSVQFDVIYSTATLTTISATAGPAAVAAGKGVTCSQVTATDFRCIVIGVNSTPIGPGVIVNLSVTTQSTTTLQLAGIVASSPSGSGMNTIGSPVTAAVTVAASLASVVCTVPSYDSGLAPNTYNIETGETNTCTITLNQPAGIGGFTAPISASTAGIVLPASVTVPQGQTTATFVAVGQ